MRPPDPTPDAESPDRGPARVRIPTPGPERIEPKKGLHEPGIDGKRAPGIRPGDWHRPGDRVRGNAARNQPVNRPRPYRAGSRDLRPGERHRGSVDGLAVPGPRTDGRGTGHRQDADRQGAGTTSGVEFPARSGDSGPDAGRYPGHLDPAPRHRHVQLPWWAGVY